MSESFTESMLRMADEAIAADPDTPSYDHLGRADALAGLGRHEEALAAYDR